LRAASLAAAAAVLLSPLLPGPLGEPARRLVNTEADGRDPAWNRPLDGDAVRRAGEAIGDDATYAVDADGADPVYVGNLKAATQLFLAPALPVQNEQNARWIVRSRDGRISVTHGPR